MHRHFYALHFFTLCSQKENNWVKGYKPFQSVCWSLPKFPSLFQGTLFCDSLKDSYWFKGKDIPFSWFKKKNRMKVFYIIDDPHAKVQPASFIPEGKLTSNQSTKDMLVWFQDSPSYLPNVRNSDFKNFQCTLIILFFVNSPT